MTAIRRFFVIVKQSNVSQYESRYDFRYSRIIFKAYFFTKYHEITQNNGSVLDADDMLL